MLTYVKLTAHEGLRSAWLNRKRKGHIVDPMFSELRILPRVLLLAYLDVAEGGRQEELVARKELMQQFSRVILLVRMVGPDILRGNRADL